MGIAGPGAVLLILATLIVLAGERISLLESAYYDFIQRQQEAPVNDRILLVDANSPDGSDGLWDPDYFSALVARLNQAGASLIVPVQAPPSNPLLPDMGQLDALAELETQARRMGQRDGNGSAAPLADQLANFRAQYATQEAIAQTVKDSNNIVLPIATTDRSTSGSSNNSDCSEHAVTIPAENDDFAVVPARFGLSMPKAYCDGALTAGYAELLPDADGVMRRLNLLVRSGSSIFPALPLAVLGASSGGKSVHVNEKNHVISGTTDIATGHQFEQLIRFYKADEGAEIFPTAGGSELLENAELANRAKDRIVLIGDLTPGQAGGVETPIGESLAPAVLVATALSNLLNGDFLWRPAWLPSAELAVLLILGIGILVSIPGMAGNRVLVTAALLAAVLLIVEGYALLAHGIWIQLISASLFTLLGASIVYVLGARQQAHAAAGPVLGGAAAMIQDDDELDLSFSVLRQQPPTEETKASLYRVAMSHGKRREFAKAERVLMYIASLDANYKDVSEKLGKLSGARKRAEESATEKTTEPVNMGKATVSTGRKLGRYELVETLGRGAMATVYVGRDPNINRKVAIKTIALAEEFSEADLEAAKLQFRREAESAGRLNHPNIIAIYDTGEDDNVAYLAMEYFEGRPLNEFSQPDTLLPPKWVLELTARAAEALHYAHGQNVVHRDIKPANILYDAASDTLKITDFGIARLTDTSRTKTGIILGTPSYMSPEQLSASAVTGKSDFYSLGITMYQLLTGTTPFRSDSIPKLMDKIMNDKHTPISAIRDDIPLCVDEVLDRVLAKDPDDRYPNGRAMALALRDCCGSFEGQG